MADPFYAPEVRHARAVFVARLAQAQEARRMVRRHPSDEAAQRLLTRAEAMAQAAQARLDRLHEQARRERDAGRLRAGGLTGA